MNTGCALFIDWLDFDREAYDYQLEVERTTYQLPRFCDNRSRYTQTCHVVETQKEK
jgi:hypothetical protein